MSEIIKYNNIDISESISISSCIHDMYAGGRTDEVKITFSDPEQIIDVWRPEATGVIEYSNGGVATGKMYLYSLRPEMEGYTMVARSMPPSGLVKNSKTWERVHLNQIGTEIAERNGLQFQNNGVKDIVYNYIKQEEKEDFKFFGGICKLEGIAMLIFDGKLIIVQESELENQEAKTQIDTTGGKFNCDDRSALEFGKCRVKCGAYFGEFSTGKNDRIYVPNEIITCSSDAEATRFAKGLLRAKNKQLKEATIEQELMPIYAPGITANIENDVAGSWSGKYYINRVVHDYGRERTLIYIREPLEGY